MLRGMSSHFGFSRLLRGIVYSVGISQIAAGPVDPKFYRPTAPLEAF